MTATPYTSCVDRSWGISAELSRQRILGASFVDETSALLHLSGLVSRYMASNATEPSPTSAELFRVAHSMAYGRRSKPRPRFPYGRQVQLGPLLLERCTRAWEAARTGRAASEHNLGLCLWAGTGVARTDALAYGETSASAIK